MGAWSFSLSCSLSSHVTQSSLVRSIAHSSLNRSQRSHPPPTATLHPPPALPAITHRIERKAPADQWTRTGLGCFGHPCSSSWKGTTRLPADLSWRLRLWACHTRLLYACMQSRVPRYLGPVYTQHCTAWEVTVVVCRPPSRRPAQPASNRPGGNLKWDLTMQCTYIPKLQHRTILRGVH